MDFEERANCVFKSGRERENSKWGCQRQQLPNKEWLFVTVTVEFSLV